VIEFVWNSLLGRAHAPVEKTQFDGAQFRHDIAAKAML